jgi:septum formation protein
LDEEGCVEGVARMNAQKKADWAAERYPADVCLGADTVVGLGRRIFHKPKDLQDAAAMLRTLSGKEHVVVTGLALRSVEGTINEVHAIRTKVFFRELTDEQIAEYFQIVNPLDKSGSYAIQQGNVVRRHEGSLTNVVGLPTEFLEERLKVLKMWDYLTDFADSGIN